MSEFTDLALLGFDLGLSISLLDKLYAEISQYN